MTTTNDPDWAKREVALHAVERLALECNGRIPWSRIAEGFTYKGQTILFASKALGIFKPKEMSGALSVKTVKPRAGRRIWYRDQASDVDFDQYTGLLSYNLAEKSPAANEYLRKSFERKSPIIYFRAIESAVYEAIFPVWIAGFDLHAKRVLLAAPDIMHPNRSSMEEFRAASTEVRQQSWTTVERKHRNHQSWFSSVVKSAYGYRCAFSGLPLGNLLVGAHIIPDSEGGLATVQNGICMSTLHHSAYDSFLIGIDSSYKIHVAPKVLNEQDGQVLEHIKNLQGQELRLPESKAEQPDQSFLERRFAQFMDNSMIQS